MYACPEQMEVVPSTVVMPEWLEKWERAMIECEEKFTTTLQARCL